MKFVWETLQIWRLQCCNHNLLHRQWNKSLLLLLTFVRVNEIKSTNFFINKQQHDHVELFSFIGTWKKEKVDSYWTSIIIAFLLFLLFFCFYKKNLIFFFFLRQYEIGRTLGNNSILYWFDLLCLLFCFFKFMFDCFSIQWHKIKKTNKEKKWKKKKLEKFIKLFCFSVVQVKDLLVK